VQVKVVDIDLEERRISLSIKRLKPNPWEELAEEIDEGDVVEGPIRNVTDFGIFVEVAPSIEGLVHVSDFSWTERVDDPHERYSVGEEVEAKVLGIDVDNQKLSLGIKQLSEDPWEEAARVAKPGEKIEVEITRLADFGAFAEVVDGVEGLIHISELAAERVNNVHEVVRPGQTVEALVVNFDRKKQRIGLSLKRDQLGEGTMREYVDEEGATATLGDILSDQLDMEESDAEAGEVDEAADEADQGEDAAESDES
ncbi:MAG: S1 RNA-binding domain-containing protein, partial [Persicimonas sp.]